jgi:hypothetical protein
MVRMPPIPRIPPIESLEKGQTTIFNTINRQISLRRPPPPSRPGPVPRTSGQSNTILGRRLVGGTNEKQIMEMFASVHLAQGDSAEGEPGDSDILYERMLNLNEGNENQDYIPRKRYSYSREQKLAAIDFFKTTWIQTKNESYERISNRYAARRLRITRKQLRSWVSNKDSILSQKRGTFRVREAKVWVQEMELEKTLNDRFVKARDRGRKISFKWMLRHARQIYQELYPHRVIDHGNGKKIYLQFQFSSGWYNNFRKRYGI